MMPSAGVLRGAGNRAVLIGRADGRVDHEHDDVGALDRALRQQHADRFDLRLRHLAGLANAGGIDDAERPPMPLQQRIHRIARRPRHLGDDHAIFAQQPIHQRRLAGVRTADDRDRGFLRLRFLGSTGSESGSWLPVLVRVRASSFSTITSSRSPTPSPCSALISTTCSKPSRYSSSAPARARRSSVLLIARITGTPASRAALAMSSSPGISPSRPSTTMTIRSADFSARRPRAMTSS